MTAAFAALLPVFAVIVLGAVLRRTGFVAAAHWDAIDHICYYVLFPAIVFKEIAAADFTGQPVWRMALAMMLALVTMFAVLLAARRPVCAALGLDGPRFTSFFQGATRWHTFIALAIVPVYFGQGALALAGLAAAAMIPLLNVVNVWVLSVHASHAPPRWRRIAGSIARNPFVLSSLGGVLWKVAGLPLPALAVQTLDVLGKGSLGLALLAVGAGLRLEPGEARGGAIAAAAVLKLLAMPALMALWLAILGVTGTPFAVAVLCGSVPTGSGAYVLARQMGGDAALVANILTVQVLAAALTVPLVIALLSAP